MNSLATHRLGLVYSDCADSVSAHDVAALRAALQSASAERLCVERCNGESACACDAHLLLDEQSCNNDAAHDRSTASPPCLNALQPMADGTVSDGAVGVPVVCGATVHLDGSASTFSLAECARSGLFGRIATVLVRPAPSGDAWQFVGVQQRSVPVQALLACAAEIAAAMSCATVDSRSAENLRSIAAWRAALDVGSAAERLPPVFLMRYESHDAALERRDAILELLRDAEQRAGFDAELPVSIVASPGRHRIFMGHTDFAGKFRCVFFNES